MVVAMAPMASRCDGEEDRASLSGSASRPVPAAAAAAGGVGRRCCALGVVVPHRRDAAAASFLRIHVCLTRFAHISI